jgi:feruloyl esterase
MKRSLSWLLCLTAVAATNAIADPADATTPCADLESLVLSNNTTITSATAPQLPFTTPGTPLAYPAGATVSTPAFCRVVAVAEPTSDSVINIEVWLPTVGWNGRFKGVGGGGTRGGIAYGAMADAISQGYATASTDGGNLSNGLDGSFALGHPEKIVDWASRAIHVMTVAGKAVTEAFYGESPQYSYFDGCSTGGHEGMTEIQRFPDEYDGVLAGAPGSNATHLHTAHIWTWDATNLDPASFIPVAMLPMITTASIAACDALDGVTDGLISDPRRCHFDPSVLLCNGAAGPNCLTKPQVEAVQKIYAGTQNPGTGALIYPGYEPGGEFGWSPLVVGLIDEPGQAAVPAFIDIIRIFAYQNPNYDWRTFDFDHDMSFVDSTIGPIVDDQELDMRPYSRRGGKLILYHGWADQYVSPQDDVNHYERIAACANGTCAATNDDGVTVFGPPENSLSPQSYSNVQKFARLFLAPGMQHCSGGPGPNSFGNVILSGIPRDPNHDAFAALVRWVEEGVPPKRIIATKYVNDDPTQGVVMTRPLCPYPAEAVYRGQGDSNDARSFLCQAGLDTDGGGD